MEGILPLACISQCNPMAASSTVFLYEGNAGHFIGNPISRLSMQIFRVKIIVVAGHLYLLVSLWSLHIF